MENKFIKSAIFFIVISFIFLNEISAQIRIRPPKIKDRSEQKADTASQVINFQVDSSNTDEDKAKLINALSSSELEEEQKAKYKALQIPDSIVIPSLDFSDQPIQDVLRLLRVEKDINWI